MNIKRARPALARVPMVIREDPLGVLIVIFWGILRVIVGFLKRDAPRMFQQLLPVLGIQMI